MKLIRKALIGLIGLFVILIAISFVLPREVSVARSITIDAPPEAVWPHVASMQNFAAWSPWHSLDPEMEQSFSGPEIGVGNRMDWTSEVEGVGTGSQVITAVEENARVETALDFGEMGSAEAFFDLAGEGAGTEVTWSFTTDMGMNPIGRYMGLMMDGIIGADYERGLAALKARVEAG